MAAPTAIDGDDDGAGLAALRCPDEFADGAMGLGMEFGGAEPQICRGGQRGDGTLQRPTVERGFGSGGQETPPLLEFLALT